MAARSSKRPRRQIALSSDDEEETRSAQSQELHTLSRASSQETASQLQLEILASGKRHESSHIQAEGKPNVSSRATRANASPQKVKARPKSKKAKTTSIYSFFSQPSVDTLRSASQQETSVEPVGEECMDIIEDDNSDYETTCNRATESKGAGRTEKLKTDASLVATRKRTAICKEINGGRRFITQDNKQIRKGVFTTTAADASDGKPWTERYKPTDLEELAVHKKKVSDVRMWLNNVVRGRERKRLLVLRGPSGSGKSTTIELLSKLSDLEVAEWRNPIGEDYSSANYVSISTQFQDFLERGGKYSGLDLELSGLKETSMPIQHAKQDDSKKRILLLEELPFTLSSSNAGLAAFRTNILCYLAANTPSESFGHSTDITRAPLVVLVSETNFNLSSSGSDSFTAHRLLGPEILHHPGTTVIDFNRVAPTILARALDVIVLKEARDSGRRRTPSTALIKQLSEIGDIRNAISSLEFLCVRGDIGDWGDRIASRNKKKTQVKSRMTKMEKEVLENVVRRSSTLDLFHAVGKVVYNKRFDPSVPEPPVEIPANPPLHMHYHARPAVSEVSVDRLADETGTDVMTFVAALHENYVLSCEGEDFLDSLENSIDFLSDADLLDRNLGGLSGNSRFAPRGNNGVDAVRQDDMVFNLAVRGLLFTLPSPVKRVSIAKGSGYGGSRDAYKMFYPASMRLRKQAEEIEGIVDRWIETSRNPGPVNASLSFSAVYTSNASFSDRANGEKGEDTTPSASITRAPIGGTSNRSELVLDVLPFAAMISKSAPGRLPNLTHLRKVVQFNGIDVSDEPVDDDSTSTDLPPSGLFPAGAATRGNGPSSDSFLPGLQRDTQKLILSDDDIDED